VSVERRLVGRGCNKKRGGGGAISATRFDIGYGMAFLSMGRRTGVLGNRYTLEGRRVGTVTGSRYKFGDTHQMLL
jgi:hypothetical protein